MRDGQHIAIFRVVCLASRYCLVSAFGWSLPVRWNLSVADRLRPSLGPSCQTKSQPDPAESFAVILHLLNRALLFAAYCFFSPYPVNMTTIQKQEWHNSGASCCSPMGTCKLHPRLNWSPHPNTFQAACLGGAPASSTARRAIVLRTMATWPAIQAATVR